MSDAQPMNPKCVSIAPMIDCTDRHFRFFLRLIAPDVLLYTEMIVADAILNGNEEALLRFDASELPLALQLGGSNPDTLAQAAKIAEGYGYSEINLNVGCPSDRVQAGRFGACLMKEPELVRECVSAMRDAVSLPVTVKTRIGVDDCDSFDEFQRFIEIVRKAPCNTFIIHARKAWLKGLSPKENRTIPPLKYELVSQIKSLYPELKFIVNGGITDLDKDGKFTNLDGIMVGREAYNNPFHLASLSAGQSLTRKAVLKAYTPYIEKILSEGVRLPYVMRHLLGLAHGIKGGKAWRRRVSTEKPGTLADYQELCEAFPL